MATSNWYDNVEHSQYTWLEWKRAHTKRLEPEDVPSPPPTPLPSPYRTIAVLQAQLEETNGRNR